MAAAQQLMSGAAEEWEAQNGDTEEGAADDDDDAESVKTKLWSLDSNSFHSALPAATLDGSAGLPPSFTGSESEDDLVSVAAGAIFHTETEHSEHEYPPAPFASEDDGLLSTAVGIASTESEHLGDEQQSASSPLDPSQDHYPADPDPDPAAAAASTTAARPRRGWGSVLAPAELGATEFEMAQQYIDRQPNPREAEAKHTLHRTLIEHEIKSLRITVADLDGAASIANGRYRTSGELEDFCFEHVCGGAKIRFCRTRRLWRLTMPPPAEGGAEGGGPEKPWLWAEVRDAAINPLRMIPPDGSWSHSGKGGRASVEVRNAGVLKQFLRRWPNTPMMMSDDDMQEAVAQLSELPGLLAELCRTQRLTLLEVQKALLPEWRCDLPFASREECVRALKLDMPLSARVGELSGLDMKCPHQSSSVRYRCARWVELMDGSVHVRLMSSAPAHISDGHFAWSALPVTSALLMALRAVPWSHDLNWAFPKKARANMEALMELPRAMNFKSDVFLDKVVPFLADPLPEVPSMATHHVGQRLECFRKGHSDWAPTNVTRVEPTTGAIQVDVKPYSWLFGNVKANFTRLPLPSPSAPVVVESLASPSDN